MRLPPELLSLVCAELSASDSERTLASFLRCNRQCYALGAPHLYATLVITRDSFPRLMVGISGVGPRDKVGWDLVPLDGVQVPDLEAGKDAGWPDATSRERKLALLAHCTELAVEEYPDLECFGLICVLDWQGGKPSLQEQVLFPNVRSVTFAQLAEPCLPGGLALSSLGLVHPLLGLLTQLPLKQVTVYPGSSEAAILRSACASGMVGGVS